jgi:GDP-L-fucose synthase
MDGAKVLVAGGSGFVGANLILRLLAEGYRVRATLHKSPATIQDPRIEYVTGDLTHIEDCKLAVEGIDYIFMCAASTSGAAVIRSNPLIHVTPNVVMNAQLLEAAYFAKVKKFLWLSSNAVYPPAGDRPDKENELLDGDPYESYLGVGWMKRYIEVLCRYYSKSLNPTMITVVIRPTNIYGPYDDFEPATSHATAATIRKVIERHDPIEVWGTGDDIRDVIYIDDFVDAVMLAMEKINTYEPLNIGLGVGHSLKELLRVALEVDDYADAAISYDPSKPSTIPVRIVDISKAEAILGFKPTTSLREGLRKTIEWYRKSLNTPRPVISAR